MVLPVLNHGPVMLKLTTAYAYWNQFSLPEKINFYKTRTLSEKSSLLALDITERFGVVHVVVSPSVFNYFREQFLTSPGPKAEFESWYTGKYRETYRVFGKESPNGFFQDMSSGLISQYTDLDWSANKYAAARQFVTSAYRAALGEYLWETREKSMSSILETIEGLYFSTRTFNVATLVHQKRPKEKKVRSRDASPERPKEVSETEKK